MSERAGRDESSMMRKDGSLQLKEAGKSFLMRANAQSIHAITDMHASDRRHCNGAYLDRSKTIERKNVSFSLRIRPDRTPVVSHACELD